MHLSWSRGWDACRGGVGRGGGMGGGSWTGSVGAVCIGARGDEGIIEQRNRASASGTFGGDSLQRLRTAINLQRDLELNLPGVALALELLSEIETLRAELGRHRTWDADSRELH